MEENKFSGYFDYYISRVKNHELITLLESQSQEFIDFMGNVPENQLDYKYESNKWSVKEVVFHIIETEILMLYRALRISRGDQTMLTGYDENMMVENARASEMEWDDLKKLFSNSRQNTLFYFKHMNSEELAAIGHFSNLTLSVEGIGYLVAGHLDHHVQVLNERYLK